MLESEERFFVVMETTDPSVIISQESNRASVVISDNENSKFLTFYLSLFVLVLFLIPEHSRSV